MPCSNCLTTVVTCPAYPDAGCVVWSGANLSNLGVVTNDRLSTILFKIDSTIAALSKTYVESGVGVDVSGIGTAIDPFRPSINLTALYGQLKITEIKFRVGDAGYPSPGDTDFLLLGCDGNPLLNKKIDLYRDGELQSQGDIEFGFTYDPVTAHITVIPSLYNKERIILKIFPINLGNCQGVTNSTGFDYFLDFIL